MQRPDTTSLSSLPQCRTWPLCLLRRFIAERTSILNTHGIPARVLDQFTAGRQPSQLAAALACRPIARIGLSTRRARWECESLRVCYALQAFSDMLEYCERYPGSERWIASTTGPWGPTMVMPDCRSCGHGAASWCDRCSGPLCHGCENIHYLCYQCWGLGQLASLHRM